MYESFRAVSIVVLVAGASALTMGCTVMSASFPVPQSHFTYPNSNVTPLGHVKGSAQAAGLTPVVQDAEMEDQAIAKALSQKGGDVLVDYTQTMVVKMIPLVFLNLYTTDITVEGTAAKMVVGKQQLR